MKVNAVMTMKAFTMNTESLRALMAKAAPKVMTARTVFTGKDNVKAVMT